MYNKNKKKVWNKNFKESALNSYNNNIIRNKMFKILNKKINIRRKPLSKYRIKQIAIYNVLKKYEKFNIFKLFKNIKFKDKVLQKITSNVKLFILVYPLIEDSKFWIFNKNLLSNTIYIYIYLILNKIKNIASNIFSFKSRLNQFIREKKNLVLKKIKKVMMLFMLNFTIFKNFKGDRKVHKILLYPYMWRSLFNLLQTLNPISSFRTIGFFLKKSKIEFIKVFYSKFKNFTNKYILKKFHFYIILIYKILENLVDINSEIKNIKNLKLNSKTKNIKNLILNFFKFKKALSKDIGNIDIGESNSKVQKIYKISYSLFNKAKVLKNKKKLIQNFDYKYLFIINILIYIYLFYYILKVIMYYTFKIKNKNKLFIYFLNINNNNFYFFNKYFFNKKYYVNKSLKNYYYFLINIYYLV